MKLKVFCKEKISRLPENHGLFPFAAIFGLFSKVKEPFVSFRGCKVSPFFCTQNLPSLKPTVCAYRVARSQKEGIAFQPSIFRCYGYVSFAKWMIDSEILSHAGHYNIRAPFTKTLTTRWWFKIFCMFIPYWGKRSNLTNIFSEGFQSLSSTSRVILCIPMMLTHLFRQWHRLQFYVLNRVETTN